MEEFANNNVTDEVLETLNANATHYKKKFKILLLVTVSLFILGIVFASITKDYDVENVLFEYQDFDKSLKGTEHVKFNVTSIEPFFNIDTIFESSESLFAPPEYDFTMNTFYYLAHTDKEEPVILQAVNEREMEQMKEEIEKNGKVEIRGTMSGVSFTIENKSLKDLNMDEESAGSMMATLLILGMADENDVIDYSKNPDDFPSILKKCIDNVGVVLVNMQESNTETVQMSESTGFTVLGALMIFASIIMIIPVIVIYCKSKKAAKKYAVAKYGEKK